MNIYSTVLDFDYVRYVYLVRITFLSIMHRQAPLAEQCCKLRLLGIPLANVVEFVRGFAALQTQHKVHIVESAELHRTASSRSNNVWNIGMGNC
eukprot:COSAG02_NODE_1800_length_10896_cov_4.915162_9_plen_94_part_00